MKTYTIVISEEQRKLIYAALEAHSAVHPELYLTGPEISDDPPGAYLVEQFAELPEDAANHPDAIHGFCL